MGQVENNARYLRRMGYRIVEDIDVSQSDFQTMLDELTDAKNSLVQHNGVGCPQKRWSSVLLCWSWPVLERNVCSIVLLTQEFYDPVHLHALRYYVSVLKQKFGPLEDIFLTIFLGSSVDYIVCVAHAHSQSLAGPGGKVEKALMRVGCAVRATRPLAKIVSTVTRPLV